MPRCERALARARPASRCLCTCLWPRVCCVDAVSTTPHARAHYALPPCPHPAPAVARLLRPPLPCCPARSVAAESEDTYKYEAEQERKAVLQGLHAPMKKWYLRADLEPEFGRFPMFWQDLGVWEHYRTVYRRYMAHMDAAEAGKKAAAAPAPSSSSGGGGGGDTSSSTADGERRKRRKSRWGQPTPSAAAADDGGDQGASKRRRTRWGSTPATPAAPAINIFAGVGDQQQAMEIRKELVALNEKCVHAAPLCPCRLPGSCVPRCAGRIRWFRTLTRRRCACSCPCLHLQAAKHRQAGGGVQEQPGPFAVPAAVLRRQRCAAERPQGAAEGQVPDPEAPAAAKDDDPQPVRPPAGAPRSGACL